MITVPVASRTPGERHGRLGGRRATVRPVVLVVGVVITFLGVAPMPVATASRPRRCNGRVEYCALRLDQVALPTTHNSMAARDAGVRFPNQQRTMARQLQDGIRGFQIDAFLGSTRRLAGRRVVVTDLSGVAQATITDTVGPRAAEAAERIRRRAGGPSRDARREVYLCHNYCELGAVSMLDESRELARFLQRHRDEVVVWVIQDELPADRLLPVLLESGLDRFVARLDPHQPLPTLGAMVDADRRLVVGLENGDLGPQIPNVFDSGLVQEVPYRYESARDLKAPDACQALRGSADAPLFQFNHWVTPASSRAAHEVNRFAFLDARARRCERERHRVPNLVAVDFYESGDLFRVSRNLNERQ